MGLPETAVSERRKNTAFPDNITDRRPASTNPLFHVKP